MFCLGTTQTSSLFGNKPTGFGTALNPLSTGFAANTGLAGTLGTGTTSLFGGQMAKPNLGLGTTFGGQSCFVSYRQLPMSNFLSNHHHIKQQFHANVIHRLFNHFRTTGRCRVQGTMTFQHNMPLLDRHL